MHSNLPDDCAIIYFMVFCIDVHEKLNQLIEPKPNRCNTKVEIC